MKEIVAVSDGSVGFRSADYLHHYMDSTDLTLKVCLRNINPLAGSDIIRIKFTSQTDLREAAQEIASQLSNA